MKTTMLHTKKIVQALALAGLVTAIAPASAADIYLRAEAVTVAMPGGVSVPMWGFALAGASCAPVAPATSCAATVPGPVITVPAGDPALNIHLTNNLAVPVSVVIPGQSAAMAPVKFTDAKGRQRVRSFTKETPVGGTEVYSWMNLKPGTYLYHSGTHPQVQVQMGLYGAVKKDAAAGSAYPGVPFVGEKVLVFSEIDPALHNAVANGSYGTVAYPSTLNYHPRYFLINGKPYVSGDPPVILTAGQKTLLRMVNAGIQTRVPVINGLDMQLVAEDGNAYPWARQQYSALLPALKTVDAIITPQATPGALTTTYPLYDRRLGLSNSDLPGEGGMFVRFQVGGSSGNAPVITSTAVTAATQGVPYGYQLTATDADGDALTYSLTSAPTGMAVNGASGLISWIPAANQTGSQAVTAKVTDATGLSASQAFAIAVANVNDPPLANADAYLMIQGGTLNVGAPGVLANDSDPDGDPLTAISAYPPGFAFNLAANGSFSYTPAATFSGVASYEYRVADGQGGISAPAMVNITVQANRPPRVVDDTATAPLRQGPVPYPAVVINVLANDSDPDTVINPANAINPSTVFITVAPNKGGWAQANANGTVSYRPRPGFVGTETFRYKVRDTLGLAASVAAYVRVNVVR